MDFETAFSAIKLGRRVRRNVWTGAHKRSLYMVEGSTFVVSRPPLDQVYAPGSTIKYLPHIDVQYVDGSCGVWTPTQEDMFANDWQIFESSRAQDTACLTAPVADALAHQQSESNG